MLKQMLLIQLLLLLVLGFMMLRTFMGNFVEGAPFWESVHVVLSANSVSWGIVAMLLIIFALVLRMNSRG